MRDYPMINFGDSIHYQGPTSALTFGHSISGRGRCIPLPLKDFIQYAVVCEVYEGNQEVVRREDQMPHKGYC